MGVDRQHVILYGHRIASTKKIDEIIKSQEFDDFMMEDDDEIMRKVVDYIYANRNDKWIATDDDLCRLTIIHDPYDHEYMYIGLLLVYSRDNRHGGEPDMNYCFSLERLKSIDDLFRNVMRKHQYPTFCDTFDVFSSSEPSLHIFTHYT